jgi:hypothetical protein
MSSRRRAGGAGGGLPDLGIDPKIMRRLSPKALRNLAKLKGKKQNVTKLRTCIKAAKVQMAQMAKNIKAMESQLASASDDAQLANIDMQNMLQKQQQTLQTMSNVSKVLHDTAMAIIRKIG